MFGRDSDDGLQRQRFTRRAMLIGAAQAGAFGLVGTRLFRLQVLDGPRYAPLADENRLNVQIVAPMRGRILDRFGEVLAANREGYRAVLVPSLAGSVKDVLALFSRLVPLSEEEQERFVQRARRQPQNVPMMLAGDLTFEQIAEINLFAPQLPGIRTEIDSRRQYFHGRTVGHVVGYVGVVSRLALDDDPVLRLPGMRTGKSGVELGMEEVLRGEGGHVKQEVDARGRIVRDIESREPSRGSDIVLTIDTKLQARALARLASEKSAAAVALDVTTGEVVVMASVPQFDTSEFSDPTAGKALRRLQTAQLNPMVNRAIRGAYPPGSTFKMVVALAALESGVVSAKERIGCDGKFELANQVFRCWKRRGHDSSDLHKALRESCDVYFYELARRTGIEAIARMARRFGLGQTYDCGIALQKAGVVPDPEWKQRRFGKGWFGGETILAGVGQGYVLATPLQLAVMMARLATGNAVVPTLIRPAPGESIAAAPPLGLKPDGLEAIRRALFAVVNEEGGTGAAARIEEGTVRLAGKTGTSQVSRASSERANAELRWEERDHALFVAYAPAARPRYAVAVIVEHAGSGGQAAGPIMRDLMADLLAQDPTSKPAYTGAPELDAAVRATGQRG